MMLDKLRNYLSNQYGGVRGLFTPRPATPKVYTKEERTQRMLRNMLNPLSPSRYNIDEFTRVRK